jgi:glycosyltransferase involved in cell wall biosynthesis
VNALSARLGGGQTYLTNLFDFVEESGAPEIFVLAPNSLKIPEGRTNIHRIPVNRIVSNPFIRAIWEKFCLPTVLRKLKVDVLFCPGGIIGARVPEGCKTVTMFRNMIPFDPMQKNKYPMGYMRLRNWLLEHVMARSMSKADRVICLSGFARRVAEDNVPGLSAKSVVIAHGVNPIFRKDQLCRPDWLPRENYILYVSQLDVYKAQLQVVQAFALLKKERKTNEKLILTGPAQSAYADLVRNEINILNLQDDVLLTGCLPYESLPALYHHALINIFASECENCPNIMLEALASGRPLLSSSRQPMPELAGDGAIYFDPASPRELADKLLAIIDDPCRLNEMSEKAKQRSQLYDWSKTARSTWDVIQQTA